MKLRIKKTHPDAILPTRAKPGDSGLDLYAYLPHDSVWVGAGCRHLIPTGISIELPEGYEGQVRPRSGMATNFGVHACLGTVDNGYRGEVGVTLFNNSFQGYRVMNGERIAQLVVAAVAYPDIEVVDELTPTDRGDAGFGSTGL